MTNQKDQSITLRVQKAKERDIGKNIIRIDPATMEEFGIMTGDVIAIKGKKESAALAWPSYPQDQGLGIVRFDSRIRKNTGSSIDDMIELSKVDALTAQYVDLTPINMKFRPNPKFETFIRRKLINCPVSLDDIIYIPIGISREIGFKIGWLKPQGICQVKKNTVIRITEAMIADEESTINVISYEDIGGLDEEIQKIRDIIHLPINKPTLMKNFKIDISQGILLIGPPGCGKSLLAEAIINENLVFSQKISGPDILSKYLGESEKKIRKIFNLARERSPSIIYIDQIDSIGMDRKFLVGKQEYSIVSELLSLMDGINKKNGIIVIASTNRPEVLDPALRRPGRFDIEIEIKPPDMDERIQIFKIHTRGIKLNSEISLEKLAEQTDFFVGADIAFICREAKLNALTRSIPKEQLESDRIDSSLMDQIELILKDFQIAFERFNNIRNKDN